VDDDETVLFLLQVLLTKYIPALQIMATTSPYEALAILQTTDVGVIVSDYQMPRMNGLEFLTELRKSNKTVPFILFTAKDERALNQSALKQGATAIHRKGTPIRTLAKALQQVVRKPKKGERERIVAALPH
jgi:CheY-like chemotaxis protein